MSVRRFLDKLSYKRCTECKMASAQETREPAVASAVSVQDVDGCAPFAMFRSGGPTKVAQDFNISRYEIQGTRFQSSRKQS
jgi:hypothetical protein